MTAFLLAKGKFRVVEEVPETWNVSIPLKNASDLEYRVHSYSDVRARTHLWESWGLFRGFEEELVFVVPAQYSVGE